MDGPPATRIGRVELQARRFGTPCAEGELIWRRWGAGPPMVLLHGGTGSWTHWIRNVLALAAEHTVWVPDMPGFGDSASPPKGANVGVIADILARGLEQLLAGEKAELVGFSFGGLVAGHLAAAHPGLFAHLTLIGAGGLGLREGRKLPLVAWRHLKNDAERMGAHRHNLANLMLWNEAKVDALALHIQSRNAAGSRINSGPFSRGDVLLEPLSRVRSQVSGIWGRHDSTVGGRLGEVEPILRRTDPRATMTVVEDAGHWVIYEAAETVNALLLSYVR
ncbi:MAG: alpha/beta fold hydrolase [Candidatus Eisenbacteria bacterium]